MLREWIKEATLGIAIGVEVCAALVVGLATLQAVWGIIRLASLHRGKHLAKHTIDVRIQLGRWLTVALEFELAADILRTTVAPTWDEIGKLGAIIVLRTLLNYFLHKEIARSEWLEQEEQIA